MTTSLRERRRQILRDEILQAAHDLIVEKSYVTMSMDELAARVGISKPTLYSFFATKEDLVVDAFLKAAEQLFAVIEAQQNQQTPLNLIIYLLTAMIQKDDHSTQIVSRPLAPDLFKMLCAHPLAMQAMRRMESLVASLFRAAIVQGEVSADLDPEALTITLFSLVHSARMASFFKPFSIDEATLHQTLMLVLQRGVKVQQTSTSKEFVCGS